MTNKLLDSTELSQTNSSKVQLGEVKEGMYFVVKNNSSNELDIEGVKVKAGETITLEKLIKKS